ncbi:MAG TPA: hypothetical protein VD735_02245 [Candidatus Saccharimonadales bacterium]|nr:hypothetical protein [Candidatus Saccharimonadales bacterium]
MRASAHKSARRNLASSKRSIVMVCAGLALILGTTSGGASLFSSDDSFQQRELAVPSTFGGQPSAEEAAATNLKNQALKTIARPQLTVTSQPTQSPSISVKNTDTNSLGPTKTTNKATATVDAIQPTASEHTPPQTAPVTPDVPVNTPTPPVETPTSPTEGDGSSSPDQLPLESSLQQRGSQQVQEQATDN